MTPVRVGLRPAYGSESGEPDLPPHGLARSVFLHLAPGLLMLGFYLATAPGWMALGLPPLFGSLVSIPAILVPWMMGYLAWEARRRTGRYEIGAVVAYRTRLSARRTVLLGLPIIVWGALVFALSDRFVAPVLLEGVLAWVPAWFRNPADFEALVALPPGLLLLFLGSLVVFAGIVAPVVEEVYFRGHLLPAVGRFGIWAPVLTVALFTLYHFESPWEAPGRFLMVLPMVFVVWHHRSVRFGIVIHVVLNTLSALGVTVAVLSARMG